MKKRAIRFVSALLCVIMLLSALALPSFAALSESAGLDALRTQWSRGKGPNVSGYDIDYSCFSPIANGAPEDQKYPLVVITPGFGSSTYPGNELASNDYAMWSSAEYQTKFNNGGAFIMIARSPEDVGVSWNSAAPIPALKAAIDDFCANNEQIDTERIYVMGWSYGAEATVRLISGYNNFAAAAVIFSQGYPIDEVMAEACRNKAVWLFGCKNDSIHAYNINVAVSWENLTAKSNNLDRVRLTSTATAPNVGLLFNHKTWAMAAYDMTTDGGCTEIKTVDGYGNPINDPSVIEWLNAQVLVPDDVDFCNCICHKNGIMGFFYKLIRIFWKFFNIHKTCECGVEHY